MTMHTEYRHDHYVVTDSDYPNLQFIVMQDDVAGNPIAESGAPVEHYVVRSGYHSKTDTPTGLYSEAYARFYDALGDTHAALEAMRRYMIVFHDWTIEQAETQVELYGHTGYLQGDWAELFVIVTEDGYGDAQGWAREWSQWAQGDVYYVTTERSMECDLGGTHWTDTNDQGVEFEGLGGIYADDVEEAVTAYLEHVSVS